MAHRDWPPINADKRGFFGWRNPSQCASTKRSDGNRWIQERWSVVSGMVRPRAELTISIACSGLSPDRAKTPATIKPARPTLWRQCTATFFPLPKASEMAAISQIASDVDFGTSRSGMGNEMKRMPLASAAFASSAKPNWAASSDSRRETITSIPARRHPLASSSSQSPPLGRATTASRPRHGPGIQKRSGVIAI